ncbi:unnamed protein product [Dibothriocephalus latus]|uniref:Desmoplakin SH3 domain-containing protein n=1 Tax=Dibothriocephalus latus TaxID=60516 RepID=A0A3P7M3C6_DIBLA|nr:unnamed protein product [Dibothriocephalus latus]
MRDLWDRSKALVERSSHIVPMRLRLGGVANGMTVGTRTERPVMVRAMTSLVGPNYRIQQGEHLRLIDTREDARLWKVQTSTGIAEVPSVCFWLTGNDLEATNRAIAVKSKCRTVWFQLLERDGQRLYENFTMLITQLASEEQLYCTNYDTLNDLLQDMVLLLPNSGLNDGRLQAAVEKLQRKVIMIHAMEQIPTSGLVLQEPDLFRMRAPLLHLQDHLEGIHKMEAELTIIDKHIAEYLSEVDNESENVYSSIKLLESLLEKSHIHLKDIMDELGQWRSASPLHEMRMKIISAPKAKHFMEYYPELAEAPQFPLGRLPSHSQSGKDKRRKSTKRSQSGPTQLSVLTQIGRDSNQFASEVHNVKLRRLDTGPSIYINPEEANLKPYAIMSSNYVNNASQGRLANASSRKAVNVRRQQGIVKRDQACSPTRDPSGDCPLCHQPTKIAPGRTQRYSERRYYDEAEALYSGTEMQSMIEFHQISEEKPSVPSSDFLICKRIQVGYPSLNPKANLFTQVNVYKNAEDVKVGDTVGPRGRMRIQALPSKPTMNSYAQITVCPITKARSIATLEYETAVYQDKKIQFEDLVPPVLMPTRQEPVFAPVPSPTPSMHEAGCECKPVMQDSSCLAKSVPMIYDASDQTTPIPSPVEKMLQVDLKVSPEPTLMVSTLLQTVHPSVQDFTTDPCPGKEMFDAGIQILMPEADIIRAEPVPVVHSAPPAPMVEYADAGCDVVSGPELKDAFFQTDQAPMFGKQLQVSTTKLHIDCCQTEITLQPSVSSLGVQAEATAEPAPVITPVIAPVVKAAPPLPAADTEDRGCDAVSGTQYWDAFVQAELPAKRPPCRGVRMQVGMSATALRDVSNQSIPVVMVGSTQTLDQTKVETMPPMKRIDDDNIFSFTRETAARVTHTSSPNSSGLIPYKTQVFASPKQISASVPTNLNVRAEGGNVTTTSTTEQLTYRQVAICSYHPRRYAIGLRSLSSGNLHTRRNRSAEKIDGYATHKNRGMCRNFVSDHELYTGTACGHCSQHAALQQYEDQHRCTDTLAAYVRRLGYETVHRTLVQVARALELEELEVTSYAEHIRSKRPRLQNTQTQYTSTTNLMNAYPSYSSPSAFPGKHLVGWIRKAKYLSDLVRPRRQEATSGEFMKSHALSAYCCDAELQESGIKTNYSTYDAFTFVSWQATERGRGRLELTTPGRLLKLNLVGARLPGSGEILAAADAFYRGILRIVYFNEEMSTMLSLPAAINTGQVIVEKQYPPGVGIAIRGDHNRYPVESEVVWTTPELRQRSYKVNYIQKSETEKVDVLTALEEGIIDQYSGEILNITLGPSASMVERIQEARESSVGSGDTVLRVRNPERFSINEAILNGILDVEFNGQETSVRADLTTKGTQDSNGSKSDSGELTEVDS